MRTAAENKFAAAAALEKQVANDPLEKFCAESPVSNYSGSPIQLETL